MKIDDARFDELMTAALYRASEIDSEDMPSDDELDRVVLPSLGFKRKMNALLRSPDRYSRNLYKPIYLKVLRTAASIFITFTVLLGVTMAVSPTARAAIIDFVRSWFEDRTEYRTPESDSVKAWSFGYIPEGFELIVLQGDGANSFRIYQNGDSTPISITVSKGKQVIDNEHSVFYQTVINARAADVYESNDPQYPSIIVIYDDTAGDIITITSEIDLSELVKIAENIE